MFRPSPSAFRTSPMRPRLLVAGLLIIDEILEPNGKIRIDAGGSALYTTLAASIFDIDITLLTSFGPDYPKNYLTDLESRGVQIINTNTSHAHSLRCRIEYTETSRRMSYSGLCFSTASPKQEEILKQLPEGDALHITPCNIDWQLSLIQTVHAQFPNYIISVDPSDISTQTSPPSNFPEIIGKTRFFLPSEQELSFYFPGHRAHTLQELHRRYFHPGQTIILKRAQHGISICQSDQHIEHLSAMPVSSVIDPTGAGDSFCGAFMANYLISREIRFSAHMASIVASRTIQGLGASCLRKTQAEDIRQEYEKTCIKDQ